MRAAVLLTTLLLLATGSPASAAPASASGAKVQPDLSRIAAEVSPERLRATISTLVGFGTRHTLSDTVSDTRGIGAARRWVAAEFGRMNAGCGGRMQIVTPSQTFTGARAPKGVEVQDVLAVLPGTSDPERVIIIAGHLDSRVTDVMNATADAPGANDDGSGVAAVMEAARVLCTRRYPATLVFAVLSGEEQGLYGGKVLADYARAQGWKVEADLNNDIVGTTVRTDGYRDDRHVRIFSEGTKAVETPEQANRRRYNGGEVDSPSRNLGRYMDLLADRYVKGLDVVMVYRTDRFGRGGDQVPLLEAGFPAVRVTEMVENYDRQHQDLRTENGKVYGDTLDGVDFPYLARVTALNAVTMASLASAPIPPRDVKIDGAVSADTTVSWSPVPGAVSYRVWWRSTTEPQWSFARDAGAGASIKLQGVVIDDWFFGVSAVSADGWESPVVFPGAAGSFESPPPAPAK